MANSPLFAKPSPLYFLQWFFGHLVFYLFGPLESVYHTSSVKSRFGIKNYFCHPNPVYTGCLLLSHLWVVMCCPLTKRLKVEFLRTCLFSTTMMWCHSPSLIKSGNQTRAPKSPVKSGCQSLLLLIGAKEILVFWKKHFMVVCNGKAGQLPLARLKIVVPVWIVDKVLRNEDVELLLV